MTTDYRLVQLERQEEGYQSGKAFAREVLNPMDGHRATGFVEALLHEHRTLQQSLARDIVWPLIEGWAEDYYAGRFDARNEATVRLAADIVHAVQSGDLKFQGFPLI